MCAYLRQGWSVNGIDIDDFSFFQFTVCSRTLMRKMAKIKMVSSLLKMLTNGWRTVGHF